MSGQRATGSRQGGEVGKLLRRSHDGKGNGGVRVRVGGGHVGAAPVDGVDPVVTGDFGDQVGDRDTLGVITGGFAGFGHVFPGGPVRGVAPARSGVLAVTHGSERLRVK